MEASYQYLGDKTQQVESQVLQKISWCRRGTLQLYNGLYYCGMSPNITRLQDHFHNQATCQSPYPSRELLQIFEKRILTTLFTLLIPSNSILNGFLVYGLVKTRQYNIVSSRLILSLSIADLATGLFVEPFVVYLFYIEDCTLSWFTTFLAYLLLNYSGFCIFLVSVDRFLRLRKTSVYAQHMHVNVMLFGLIIVSIGISIAMVLSAHFGFFCYFNMVVISINAISAMGIVIFYVMAWLKVKQQMKKMQSFRNHPATTFSCIDDNTVARKSNSKLAYDSAMTRTIAAILICCCITYPPYFVVSFIRSLTSVLTASCDQSEDFYDFLFFLCFFLMHLNSSANAVLYSCHNRQLKALLKSIFERNLKPKTRSERKMNVIRKNFFVSVNSTVIKSDIKSDA